MSLPAIIFNGLLSTLAGQFIEQEQEYAECIVEDFGSQFNQNAKLFFSVSLIEEDLPHDLAAIGVLVDNKASENKFLRTGYTFFIYIDSSKKHTEITDDLKTISGVNKRTIDKWVGASGTEPKVNDLYKVCKVLVTTMEWMIDGETGAEYVRGIVKNDPKTVQVPDRIYPIVECLLVLNDRDLSGILAQVQTLAGEKKGN